ncbi:hypothetical protein WA026_001141 [Henosepilachna vigintioctopunctata]
MIFTKVYRGSLLKYKFTNLIANLLNVSSVPLMLNVIVDNSSRGIAEKIIVEQIRTSNRNMTYSFYNIDYCAKIVNDIVEVMSHFFSKPGSYYSDVLFYISLGLHRIAPKSQKHAILMDCDVFFKRDISLLFDEFQRFKDTALFGLAPELSPVYRHVLKLYRSKHNNTTFGNYYHWNATSDPNIPHSRGFQGYNSGILLLKLDAIRSSEEFKFLLKKSAVQTLTERYNFKQGHLGDQDFYTLIGNEYPHLIQTLNCGFNKQLCTWWKENGYSNIFDNYARCDHKIVVLHGNCNSKIPKS